MALSHSIRILTARITVSNSALLSSALSSFFSFAQEIYLTEQTFPPPNYGMTEAVDLVRRACGWVMVDKIR